MRQPDRCRLSIPLRLRLAAVSALTFLATIACAIWRPRSDPIPPTTCYMTGVITDTPDPIVTCYEMPADTATPTATPFVSPLATPTLLPPTSTPEPSPIPTCYAPPAPAPAGREALPAERGAGPAEPASRAALLEQLLDDGRFPAPVAGQLKR